MKLYYKLKSPLDKAIQVTLDELFRVGMDEIVTDMSDANVIFVDGRRDLNELYTEDKYFVLFGMPHDHGSHLPENVHDMRDLNPMKLAEFLSRIEGSVVSSAEEQVEVDTLRFGVEYSSNEPGALRVLVVDDKEENLQLAQDQLHGKYRLTLAHGFGQGEKLVAEGYYDAVLTDCQMPMTTDGNALSPDVIELGQTVHNGLFLVFFATAKGAKVAVVTDANHHRDWVSAMFDKMRGAQTVNGQQVLFINNMGKDWVCALDALLSL